MRLSCWNCVKKQRPRENNEKRSNLRNAHRSCWKTTFSLRDSIFRAKTQNIVHWHKIPCGFHSPAEKWAKTGLQALKELVVQKPRNRFTWSGLHVMWSPCDVVSTWTGLRAIRSPRDVASTRCGLHVMWSPRVRVSTRSGFHAIGSPQKSLNHLVLNLFDVLCF